jgi:hypothetical protein
MSKSRHCLGVKRLPRAPRHKTSECYNVLKKIPRSVGCFKLRTGFGIYFGLAIIPFSMTSPTRHKGNCLEFYTKGLGLKLGQDACPPDTFYLSVLQLWTKCPSRPRPAPAASISDSLLTNNPTMDTIF